ncbi:flagellar basal body-associated protein FliL [Pseudochelatococcus sp. G4_1912]|uniref:flagellar basal body-associated FliL family protein n=1 Tax=Pseudochelatococcus sp. G4_1912 TaxID=3114288 RepID=UPI0039C6AFDB
MSDVTVVENPPAPPQEGGARTIIMAIVVLTLLAILLGGGIGFLMSSSIEKNIARKEEQAASSHSGPAPKHYTDDITLVQLEPITTNLMSPDSVFIKIESSLVVPKEVGEDKNLIAILTAEISQDLLTFMRTVTLAQLQGPSGLQNLREDLSDRVAIRSEGKVRELILETVVVQ